MPEPGELPPFSMPEGRSKLARETGHRAQMVFKIMDDEGAIFVSAYMGEKTCRLSRIVYMVRTGSIAHERP